MNPHVVSQHLILTNGRSGSNFLVDVINQHPQLCSYGEVLGAYTLPARLHERTGYGGSTWSAYLDHVLSSRRHFALAQGYSAVARLRRRQRPRPKRWADLVSVGVKDFSIRFRERGLHQWIQNRPDLKVILLHRDSPSRALSYLMMSATGVVKQVSGDRSTVSAYIDPAQLETQIRVLEHERLDQFTLAERSPNLLVVDYAELFHPDTTRRVMVGVYEHLGVDPIEVEPAHRRILDDTQRQVLNYEQVAHLLA